MNHYQALARARQTRRFTKGDGVVVLEGPYRGQQGVVRDYGHVAVECEAERPYYVAFPGDAPGLDRVFLSKDLQSEPAGNTGKYGGPSRGGAYDGYCGFGASGYRA